MEEEKTRGTVRSVARGDRLSLADALRSAFGQDLSSAELGRALDETKIKTVHCRLDASTGIPGRARGDGDSRERRSDGGMTEDG